MKDDFPMTDERWTRFYSKFVVVEGSGRQSKYSLVPTLVALIFLSQGNSDQKAVAIAELFSEHKFLGSVMGSFRDSVGSNQLKEIALTSEQLKCILTIFVNISLILLPLYASDYPSIDKRQYFKLLV